MKLRCLLSVLFTAPRGYIATGSVTDNPSKTYSRSIFAPYLNKIAFSLLFTFAMFSAGFSQNTNAAVDKELAYTKTINERADKIVATLNIADAAKASRVRDIIASQYRSLNDIHTDRDAKIKAAKSTSNAEAINAQVGSIQDAAKVKLDRVHSEYLKKLSSELTPQQVDQVKDGMTYNVVHVTYKAYQAMIPTLTEEQKKQIMTWLIEARELAMDAENSDKKHATFGKYKGRINNYLSAAGYDLRKEGEDWEKRRKAEEAAKKGQ